MTTEHDSRRDPPPDEPGGGPLLRGESFRLLDVLDVVERLVRDRAA